MSITLPEERTGDGLGSPAIEWFYIVPSDTANLRVRPRAIYVGVAGNVSMRSASGETVIFKSLAIGYHPLRPNRVLSTGTTATDIIGLY
jgi:hypothetical protein